MRAGLRAAALLCAALAAGDAAAAANKKQELSALRERIERLQKELSKSEESRSEAADALRTSEKAISEANRALAALAREQAAIGQSLADLKRRIEETRAGAADQQALLDRIIRHQYQHGGADGLRLMLEGRDVAEVSRQMHYFGYVSRARAALVSKLKASTEALVALEAEQRDKQAALAANEEEQRVAKKQLEAERVARQKTVDRIKADISRGRREIGRLKRDEDRLAKLVDQLVRALAKARSERKAEPPKRGGEARGEVIDRVADATLSGRAFESLRGKLRLPVRGELQGRFGSPREEGGVTWKGVFIKAESGTPVRAVADGQVVYADWLRGFGNLLVVDHGNGYLSIYGNNESLLKQVGEMATGGEAIASAGSSGGALESGVYFELRHEGKPFDPMKWVGR